MPGRTSTSLGRQLERLKRPETNQFSVKRGRDSFLYSSEEAASIDSDTHYSLALEGFESLCTLDPSLTHFHSTLLDHSAKDWSRTNCTRDVLQRMDKEVESFVWRGIAPHFLLRDSHKVLEWLIHKFRVHEAIPDTLILALSPFSETRLFPKLLQCVERLKSKSHKWHFLYPNQKTGTPVSKNGLISHVTTRSWFMAEMNRSVTMSSCQPVLVHATSMWMGVLSDHGHNSPDQVMISLAIEFCIQGFKSPSKDRVMSAITVFSFIASKYTLQPSVVRSFLKKSASRMTRNGLLEQCIKNYLLMLLVICRSQEVEKLPESVLKVVLKFLPVIQEDPWMGSCEELVQVLVSSLDTESKTYFEDVSRILEGKGILGEEKKTILGEGKKRIPRRLVPFLEVSAKKRFEGTSDPCERADVVAGLLRLQVSSGQSMISSVLSQLLSDGSFFPEVVEKLTLLPGTRKRPVFDPTRDAWKSLLLLLEHFMPPRMFLGSTQVLTHSFSLLKESFLVDSGSDFFKRSLLSVITNCTKQSDVNLNEANFDTSVLLDSLKFIRHDASHKECFDLLMKVLTKNGTTRDRQEMAKKLAISFSFIGTNLSKCDDRFSLEMLNETIDRLVPLILSKDSDLKVSKDGDPKVSEEDSASISSLLQIFIDALPDIPNHRRLDIFSRILHLAADPKWSALTIVKLVEANFGPGRPDFVGLNFSVELLPHLPPDHHQVIFDTLTDLLVNKSNSLMVTIHGMELKRTDELKVKLSRFMASIASEGNKLSVNVPSIVRSLVDTLPSLVPSSDDGKSETRKRIENSLLLAIERVSVSSASLLLSLPLPLLCCLSLFLSFFFSLSGTFYTCNSLIAFDT